MGRAVLREYVPVTTETEIKKNPKHRQWITAIVANFTLLTIGMFLGWCSPVIEKMQDPNSDVHLTDSQISWMISIMYIGSLISPIATGRIIDIFGRKSGLYLTMIQAIIAWLLLLTTTSPTGIYTARFLTGMVSGSGITAVPIYLSEIAEPELRGGLNIVFSLMSYVGIISEYIIGPFCTYWTLNLISTIIVIILTCLIYFIPETPYYCMMKQNRPAAMKSLAWLRCLPTTAKEVQDELDLIEQTVSKDFKEKKSVFDLVKTKGNRRALFIAETLAIIQRMTGISVIMAYASTATPSSWIINKDQCSIMLCSMWILFSFLSTFIVDRCGRKVLQIVSSAGCAISLSCYAAFDYLITNTDLDLSRYDWFKFATLFMFSIFYPMGLGCVTYIIQGEMFPQKTKGVASGITSIVYAIVSFITNKIYQPIGSEYGYYINYCIYAVWCVVGIFFGLFGMIETKGKTLQQIQDELSGKKQSALKTQNEDLCLQLKEQT